MVRMPTTREPTHPGKMLLEEFLKPMNLTQRELADGIHSSWPGLPREAFDPPACSTYTWYLPAMRGTRSVSGHGRNPVECRMVSIPFRI